MASTLRSFLRHSPSSSSSSKLHPLALPPAFLLPRFAQLSTTANITDPEPLPAAFKPAQHPPPASKLQQTPRSQRPQALSPSPLIASNAPSQTQSASDSPISAAAAAEPLLQSQPSLLPAQLHLLAAQPPHYINVLIHGKHYLLTEGDVLRLPFKMPDAPVGSVLRLTRASMLGSRDYTYRGNPVIDERHFLCRARVTAIVTEPMRVKEKTKQRQRRVKTVKSKMRYTVLRITELRVMADGSEEDSS